jgi:hypothetical protein
MAAIGWIAGGLTEADEYYATRAGAITLWSGLSDPEKTAALTTAYNRIRKSREVSIPANPTAEQLEDLVYAQEEYALHFVVLDEGGIRREAIQGQNVKSAGIIKESYGDKPGGLPDNIMEILDGFKTQKPFYSVPIFRDEDENDAYDRHFGI